MPSFIKRAESLPTQKRAKELGKLLDEKLRWNPDANDADSQVAAIVNAYANGDLIVRGENN